MTTKEQLESIKKVACRYDNVGSAERFYDGKFTKSHRTSRLSKQFEFVKDLNLSNETILDIGCSGGRYSQLLMHDNDVYSIDTSINCLNFAKSKASKVSLIRASITHLPFKKEKFTLVLCIELLHHLDNKMLDDSIKEISRVTVSDGRLVCDLRNSLNAVMWFSYKKRDGKFFPLKTRSIFMFSSILRKYNFSVIKRKGLFFINSFFAPYVIFIGRKGIKE